MVRFMRNIYFRAVAIALIISFITTDISWACPQCGTGNSSTLATQSIFQQNMITEAAEKYRGSILADSNLLGSVYSIARYLLGDADAGIDPLPIKYMEEMLTAELGSALNGIDLSKVTLTDGVAYIPFVKGDKKHILQIALKGNKSFMSLSGYEWPVFDKYVVKDLPEDYSHVSAAQPMTKSFPADSTPDASSGSGQTSPANPLSMKRIKPAGINDEYIQIKTAHKREVIIKNLSSVLKNGVPDSFVKDFVDGMPNEHLERAAIARLVNEIVFSYLMFNSSSHLSVISI